MICHSLPATSVGGPGSVGKCRHTGGRQSLGPLGCLAERPRLWGRQIGALHMGPELFNSWLSPARTRWSHDRGRQRVGRYVHPASLILQLLSILRRTREAKVSIMMSDIAGELEAAPMEAVKKPRSTAIVSGVSLGNGGVLPR